MDFEQFIIKSGYVNGEWHDKVYCFYNEHGKLCMIDPYTLDITDDLPFGIGDDLVEPRSRYNPPPTNSRR